MTSVAWLGSSVSTIGAPGIIELHRDSRKLGVREQPPLYDSVLLGEDEDMPSRANQRVDRRDGS